MSIIGVGSRPTQALSYSAEWLQVDRPQAMYDKNVNRLFGKIFAQSPADDHDLIEKFKLKFLSWLKNDNLNSVSGFSEGYSTDVCIGCTHYIDDLYQTLGSKKIMIFAGDYRYHWRLNPNIKFATLETLDSQKHLLIAMPFPSIGDIHPQMSAILDRCLQLKIPVHIDAAWLSCSRGITFDFSHPAIQSFAVSLSKGFGLGGNRIAMRFVRERKPGPITIMNDFNMNCQSLVQVGLRFLEELGPGYFWHKYGDSYDKICRDFDLLPTKAIHLAMAKQGETYAPVGVRLLLRYLSDK